MQAGAPRVHLDLFTLFVILSITYTTPILCLFGLCIRCGAHVYVMHTYIYLTSAMETAFPLFPKAFSTCHMNKLLVFKCNRRNVTNHSSYQEEMQVQHFSSWGTPVFLALFQALYVLCLEVQNCIPIVIHLF